MRVDDLFRRPISTYRLQLHSGFGFAAARDIVPYLAALGVTECYSSPHFKANPGSRHGYDIGDYRALNPELGSEEDYDALCSSLASHGLGHIVDVVPNHMAADPRSNPWWWDVLENGPSSPFAEFFDVDWTPVKPELRDKVLLPVLGDQYGRVLERGELQLRYERGALHLRYGDLDLPVNPRQAPRVLGVHVDRLERAAAGDAAREFVSILTALRNLPAYTERDPGRITDRQREKEIARGRLARLAGNSVEVRTHIEAIVREANGVAGEAASFDRLHDLLEHQAYRLAYWRTASDEINYRRFFDINELVGFRIEQQPVFDAAHVLVKQLIDAGKVTGLRIDHPDGLLDPATYFDRLQRMASRPFYVVAEKILSNGERLQEDWQVAGTTGYEFMNHVTGLFIDARHVRALRRVYTRLTGRAESFEDVAYRSRLTVMLTTMASELNLLAHTLNRLSELDRTTRDFTLSSCRRVLREVAACFPVYRTYISGRGAGESDRAATAAAITEARRRNPVMEGSIFEFLRQVLFPPPGTSPATDALAGERLQFALKWQQFTAPIQAKGVEDTAFYRYHACLAATEVGGHPSHPALSPADFHAANAHRREHWPLGMTATMTHDAKRGEDARARLAVLSEMPEAWRSAVASWMRLNARHRTRVRDGWAPNRNDEYLFYQTLIGVWPAEPLSEGAPARAPADLVERLTAYMAKAIREAKLHTSWIHGNAEYEGGVEQFVRQTLTGVTAARFLDAFVPVQRRIAAAGMLNSLSQLVLKLTAPGVPDFYQGTELWDFSLVDPDNRRPVDFAVRRARLESLDPLFQRLDAGAMIDRDVAELLDRWPDGRVKLFITACGLRLRRRHPDLLLAGEYHALETAGPLADRVVAFGRRHGADALLTIVPRLPADARSSGRLDPGAWATTRIRLPEWARGREYRHVLTGERIPLVEDDLVAGTVFRTSPVAMLWASQL